jgi:serine/threonine protein kinase
MKYMKADDKSAERELFIKNKFEEQDCSTANLVYYVESFKINSVLYFVMEYFEKGDLGKFLCSSKENQNEVKKLNYN